MFRPLLLIAIWSPLLRAQTPDVQTIIDKANQASYYAGQDGRADVAMVITDGNGGTREREFTILRMNTGDGDQKFYVYFKAPADVSKTAFLVWKNAAADKDDDRWLWLPALNLSRRIAPGDKRTSFVGSDFFYEDVSGRRVDADSHQLEEETDRFYIIKSTPKPGDKVEFASYRLWIDKQNFLPLKTEYMDRNGEVFRRIEGLAVETFQDIPTVTHSVAQDLRSGSKTELRFSNIQYNQDLKENIFSERFLRRPPREVTR